MGAVIAPVTPEELSQHERREAAFSERVRAQILERDDNTCQSCGQGGENRLTLHHVVFRSQGGTGEEENGVTLCFECHADVHAGLLEPHWIEWRPGRFAWFFRRLAYPRRWTQQQRYTQ